MQLATMLRFKMAWAEAEGPGHDVVLSSRVRLARNLDGAAFPSHGPPKSRSDVLARVLEAARAAPGLKGAAYFDLGNLDETDLRFLVERHLASPALVENPASRGLLVGARESLSVMVNEEDHIRLASFRPGLELKTAWETADGLDDDLESGLRFAYGEQLGYLTACPTNLGTGMRASCLVHLPALSLAGVGERVFSGLGRMDLALRGLHGEGTKVIGDLYQISNATALGRTEGEILAAVEKAVSQLAEGERANRKAIASGSGRRGLEDRIHRSAGTLTHARLLSFEEAGHHLSLLRMGLGMGWDVPGDLAAINELLILSQAAHLMMRAGKELMPPERDFLRAELIRGRLSGSAW